jgi:hypothetical protein
MRCTFIPNDTAYDQRFSGFPAAMQMSTVFAESPQLMGSMLAVLHDWQCNAKGAPAGSLFTAVPFGWTDPQESSHYHLHTGAILLGWSLVDQAGTPMSSALTATLFGVADAAVTWTPIDQNNPFAADPTFHCWYLNVQNQDGAVASPCDAFFNWIVTAPASFFPAALSYHNNYYSEGGLAALVAAGDVPPSSPMGVSATVVESGPPSVGQSSYQSVTLINRQTVRLNDIQLSVSPAPFATTPFEDSLAAQSQGTVGLTFTPAQVGSYEGVLTVTSDAPNSPMVVALSGIGNAAPAVGQIIWLGDPSLLVLIDPAGEQQDE